jgi:hypothetical protein
MGTEPPRIITSSHNRIHLICHIRLFRYSLTVVLFTLMLLSRYRRSADVVAANVAAAVAILSLVFCLALANTAATAASSLSRSIAVIGRQVGGRLAAMAAIYCPKGLFFLQSTLFSDLD